VFEFDEEVEELNIIYEEELQETWDLPLLGTKTWKWDQKDNYGNQVQDGNYCFVDHNNIVDNRIGAVVAHCSGDLRHNWWESPSGPGGIGPGSGDIIELTNGTVLYEP
jgi:hypothetical protein